MFKLRFLSNFRSLLLISVLNLFILTNAFAGGMPWVHQIIDLTINTDFDAAESLLTARTEKGDTSLTLDFYRASLLNSKRVHYENRKSAQPFLKAVGKLIHRAEKMLVRNPPSGKKLAQAHYYLGSAYAFLTLYEGKKNSWFSALKFGIRARDNLKQALYVDSTLYDAMLALGSYKYWSSARTGWLPFVSDQRAEGIRLVKKAIRYGTYSRYTGMHQLVYILLDKGDYVQAGKWAEKCIRRYPRSTFMYWAYSHVFMKEKNYAKAINSYKTLLRLLSSSKSLNPNHPLVCRARLGDMYARSGKCKLALEQVDRILTDGFYKTKKDIPEVERLVDEIQNRCN